MRLTREQAIHTAIHSGKYPVGLLLGWVLGTYAGAQSFYAVVIAMAVGYIFELASDVQYWWAINKRPRSGAMQNSEPLDGEGLGAGDCIQCGHTMNEHDADIIPLIRCSKCGCKWLDQ